MKNEFFIGMRILLKNIAIFFLILIKKINSKKKKRIFTNFFSSIKLAPHIFGSVPYILWCAMMRYH